MRKKGEELDVVRVGEEVALMDGEWWGDRGDWWWVDGGAEGQSEERGA